MSNQSTQAKKENTQAHQMNEVKETMETWMKVPAQMGEMMMANMQATQKASLEYFKAVEKIQRETTKNVAELWSTMLPGENTMWKTQMDMVEKSFDMAERMMTPKA